MAEPPLRPRPKPRRLSIVIPLYNEEEVFDELRKRVTGLIDGVGGDAEVILVNDGSRDGTQLCMESWAASDRRMNPHFQLRSVNSRSETSFGDSLGSSYVRHANYYRVKQLLCRSNNDCKPRCCNSMSRCLGYSFFQGRRMKFPPCIVSLRQSNLRPPCTPPSSTRCRSPTIGLH
jgi:glycosyltransferase involved in cell wall biosynthesis